MAHASCVMRPRVRRPDSWLMRHASCVLTHGSRVMRHASGVHAPRSTLHAPRSTLHAPRSTLHAPRSTLHAPRSTRPAGIQQHSAPPAGGISHRLDPLGQCPINALNFAPLSYMAGGSTTLLPPPYSSTGANKNSGRRSFKRRPLFSLNEKRPALMKAPAAVAAHTKKAGIMPALLMVCC